MDKVYYAYLAQCKLTAIEYKIVLMLLIKPYTSAQLERELGCMKSNAVKHMKKLKSLGLIELERTEGHNKFYKPVTDIKKLMAIMPGQLKIE